jgi:hypothetical protein
MARGFESKMVEFNQEEAARRRPTAAPLGPGEQARLARRATLALARTRAVSDLATATRPAHKAMLEQAIKSLDDQLSTLDAGSSVSGAPLAPTIP